MARSWGVGELARRGRVSVRTLQHYDHLGLLPAARSEAGLRSYAEDDLATLQQIQFLQSTGLSLAEVADALRTSRRTTLYAAQRDALERQAVRCSARARILDGVLAVLAQVPDATLPVDLLTALLDADATVLAYADVSFAEASTSPLTDVPETELLATYLTWRGLSVEALLLVENGIEPDSSLGRDLGRRWQELADAVTDDAEVAAGYASIEHQDDRWPAADRDLKRRTEGFVDRCQTAYLTRPSPSPHSPATGVLADESSSPS